MRGLASERETLLEKVRARETDGDAMVTVTRAARERETDGDDDEDGAQVEAGRSTPPGGAGSDAEATSASRAADGGRAYGGKLMGCPMAESAAFALASTCCIVFIGASCYFEEYVYKSLPNFHYYWTVALAELLVFSLISSASSIADGTLFAPRKAPFELYLIQALLLAAYSAVGKLCYKWINYATGTVLRSSKLVFTMIISMFWLQRKYKAHQIVAAALLVVAVACFGIAEHDLSGGKEEPINMSEVDPVAILGQGDDVKLLLGFGFSAFAIFLGSLQTNVSEHAMRNHDAGVRENILYTNVIGTVFALAGVVAFEGSSSLVYLRTTKGAFALLLARSVTFYFGAYFFSVLTRHFGATSATAVTTLRKALTVILSFVLFPSDKPFTGYFVYGLLFFLLSIFVESAPMFNACVERVHRARRGEYSLSPHL